MTYPNEQLPAGRPLKMAPAHDAMTEAGCQWGNSWDLEVPLYFASKEFEENPSLKRSNAFPIIGDECKTVRTGVGLLDITGFSRFEVSGPNAEAWLDNIMASKLPKPGRAGLAPMLSEEGKLKGDLTVFNWGDGTGGSWVPTIYAPGTCGGSVTTLAMVFPLKTLEKTGPDFLFPVQTLRM